MVNYVQAIRLRMAARYRYCLDECLCKNSDAFSVCLWVGENASAVQSTCTAEIIFRRCYRILHILHAIAEKYAAYEVTRLMIPNGDRHEMSTTCSPNNDPSSVLTVERVAPTITSPQSSEGQESSCLRVDLVAPSGESFTVSENPPEAQVWMNGKKDLVVRWTLIEKKLREPINSLQKLQDAILSYNERFKSAWNFSILRDVIENDVPDGNLGSFFRDSLPALCALALNLPIYLTQPIPLMRSGCEMSFTFSQLQIASLLANAFFCTFPRRNSRGRNAEFARFPFINFSRLFSGPQNTYSLFRGYNSQREKIRCLLHYFHRVTRTVPTGTVTYTRRCLGNLVPDWSKSTRTFDQLRIHINSQSTIEEAGVNTLQVDFANKFLGGGVLSSGCVQEEIMFVLRPELLATCLFVECLGDDEAVLIEGAETYSQSSGYADTFKWTGDFSESHSGMERDEWCRWKTTVVAIDATYFSSPKAQFTPEMIQRELNKAYCGFTDDLAPGRKLPSVVATGNWGCGAFRGNVDLKALIQMMACVQAGKSLAYFTFGDKALLAKLYDMYIFLSSNSVTVGPFELGGTRLCKISLKPNRNKRRDPPKPKVPDLEKPISH
ncbi:poly(ADP-ribose) glycohydrolase [Clonorchis sinensis]|uniref:poly(ADP-ribose) glycohydrolase n=1 Tax=Clonorchis sinensis TaxID=79923 RepID=H2KUX8_CLOSI|nr:poly(ADP-ribose) glycohydrolase [Clonorchis sinensis]